MLSAPLSVFFYNLKGGVKMRKYYLASSEERKNVDLRNYQKEITAAVHKHLPQATVTVEERYYTVHPTPDKGSAIRIGRILSSKDVLGECCVQIPKLFCSEEIGKGMSVNGNKKKRPGGHQ